MSAVLEGIKILDLTEWMHGSRGTGYLADFGAEVIKVEGTRQGDPSRNLNAVRKRSVRVLPSCKWNYYFECNNRSKKSIAIDLRRKKGREILYQFGEDSSKMGRIDILHRFNEVLYNNSKEGKKSILIIDEAQFIAESTLEEIRLLLNYQLSNRFLLTIFLMGQPELVDKVKAIKQLAQRVEISYFLRSFNFKETTDYIFFREKKAGLSKNVFSKQAIEIVFEHSNGIPRIINNLCDLALLVGSGEKKTMITYEVIKDIIDDGAVF